MVQKYPQHMFVKLQMISTVVQLEFGPECDKKTA